MIQVGVGRRRRVTDQPKGLMSLAWLSSLSLSHTNLAGLGTLVSASLSVFSASLDAMFFLLVQLLWRKSLTRVSPEADQMAGPNDCDTRPKYSGVARLSARELGLSTTEVAIGGRLAKVRLMLLENILNLNGLAAQQIGSVVPRVALQEDVDVVQELHDRGLTLGVERNKAGEIVVLELGDKPKNDTRKVTAALDRLEVNWDRRSQLR